MHDGEPGWTGGNLYIPPPPGGAYIWRPGGGGNGGRADGPGRGSPGIYTASNPLLGLDYAGDGIGMGSGADGGYGQSGNLQSEFSWTIPLAPLSPRWSGAAGGSGGGAIRLYAKYRFTVFWPGKITVNGTAGRQRPIDHRTGTDVDSSDPIAKGAEFTGAGGGLLLACENTPIVLGGGTLLQSLGGGTRTENGGVVILRMPTPPAAPSLAPFVRSGSFHVEETVPPPIQAEGLMIN